MISVNEKNAMKVKIDRIIKWKIGNQQKRNPTDESEMSPHLQYSRPD